MSLLLVLVSFLLCLLLLLACCCCCSGSWLCYDPIVDAEEKSVMFTTRNQQWGFIGLRAKPWAPSSVTVPFVL